MPHPEVSHPGIPDRLSPIAEAEIAPIAGWGARGRSGATQAKGPWRRSVARFCRQRRCAERLVGRRGVRRPAGGRLGRAGLAVDGWVRDTVG